MRGPPLLFFLLFFLVIAVYIFLSSENLSKKNMSRWSCIGSRLILKFRSREVPSFDVFEELLLGSYERLNESEMGRCIMVRAYNSLGFQIESPLDIV